MSRPHAWPEMLAEFIDRGRTLAFSWERHNCGFWACEWAGLVTGIDPADGFRNRGGALETMRAIRKAGGAEGIFSDRAASAGWQEVSPAMAIRGDVLLFNSQTGASLGVCVGAVGAFLRKQGLAFIPINSCARAWRI